MPKTPEKLALAETREPTVFGRVPLIRYQPSLVREAKEIDGYLWGIAAPHDMKGLLSEEAVFLIAKDFRSLPETKDAAIAFFLRHGLFKENTIIFRQEEAKLPRPLSAQARKYIARYEKEFRKWSRAGNSFGAGQLFVQSLDFFWDARSDYKGFLRLIQAQRTKEPDPNKLAQELYRKSGFAQFVQHLRADAGQETTNDEVPTHAKTWGTYLYHQLTWMLSECRLGFVPRHEVYLAKLRGTTSSSLQDMFSSIDRVWKKAMTNRRLRSRLLKLVDMPWHPMLEVYDVSSCLYAFLWSGMERNRPPSLCLRCGELILLDREKKQYCSPTCRSRARQKRYRENKKAQEHRSRKL